MKQRELTVAEQSFAERREYKGLDIRNLVTRPGALDILGKPSLVGGKTHPYKSIFKQEREDGNE